MRSYQETLDYLYSRLPMFTRIGAVAFKKDLSNTLTLCAELDQAQQKFRSIHIAGTNGKGSTSHMLAAIFQSAGYKTGLYTSPHLRDFRERIKVNGEMISEEDVISFTERMTEAIEKIEPSFFELTVAMAFDHFAREKVDIAIIETGMGGRLDSTNVIKPELSLITNIGFDHMEFLGNTLPKIALEKAGIIKEKTPVVIGKYQEEIIDVFKKTAGEKHCEMNIADKEWKIELVSRGTFSQHLKAGNGASELHIELDLPGSYQVENLATVLASVEQINKSKVFRLNTDAVLSGLANVKGLTGLMGRWQCLSEQPLIICDTGHNEDGIRHILQMLSETPHKHLRMVIGMVKDKEVGKILKLLPSDATYYFTQANIPRAMAAESLFEEATKVGLKGKIAPKVGDALKEAKTDYQDGELIFVGGSTFVVAEVV